MMAITHADLTGVETDLARRVLAFARTIVPCLDSLVDEPKAVAVAILKAVATESTGQGSRRVRSMSRNGSSIGFTDVGSMFFPDDRASLRALCGLNAGGALPLGSFPDPGAVGRVWPETGY